MKSLALFTTLGTAALTLAFFGWQGLVHSSVPAPAVPSANRGEQIIISHQPAKARVVRVKPVPTQPSSPSVPVAAAGTYALTFDDGPHPVYTPQILDWLKGRGIKATFFILGQNAKRYPEIVKRIAKEGHEIGNHTWSHPLLTRKSLEVVRSEVKRTHDLIVSLTGKTPVSFRPPYGALTISQRATIEKEFGYQSVLWNADSLDWKLGSNKAVADELRPVVKSGSVILAHDIHPRILPVLESLYPEWTRRGLKAAPLGAPGPAAPGGQLASVVVKK